MTSSFYNNMSPDRRFCYDDETGEVTNYTVNGETGEPCVQETYYNPYNPRPGIFEINLPRGCGYDGKKFRSLKANIVAGSNLVSYRMLLIPTLMICPSFLCIVLMVLEIYLHVQCHKQNKSLEDSTVYYRSPFHAVTSTFCGACRESDLATKVKQLQDQRRDRYRYLRGIVL